MAKPRTQNEAREKLHRKRLTVEERLDELRRAIGRELGWTPKTKMWIVPLMAFACGVALALAKRRGEGSEESKNPPAQG